MSEYDTKLAKPAKLPSDFNFCAARVKPVHAARANAPPTLMRRTPSAAMSAIFKPMSRRIRTLTGLGRTASTSALIVAGSWGPGANSTSAPASANARRRRTDSRSASRWPTRKHSALDVGTGLIDRLARSAHALDGERQLVERRRWITSCILDRQPRDAGRDAACDI